MDILNIISDSYEKKIVGGPYKVILNVIKGLELLGYPYVLNQNVHEFKRNWIHDSLKGFIEVTNSHIPAVIGPNIFTLPKDIPFFTPGFFSGVYLHPADWCVDIWKELDYKRSLLRSWPVGIDTNEFNVEMNRSSDHVMIYFKNREIQSLEFIENKVKSMGFVPMVIKYGSYTESEYRRALSLASFGIWIGCSESQGIALQEALSTNLPLIICDVDSLLASTQTQYKFPIEVGKYKATSVPYFDERCGIIIEDLSKIEDSIKELKNNFTFFTPREFIIENLSLEKQAKELLSFFDLLEKQQPEYFKKEKRKAVSGKFRLSLIGYLTFIPYVFMRKLKTLIKIVRQRLVNHNNFLTCILLP